jgi:hypothetical protein
VALSKKVLHEFCADKPAAANDDNFPYIRSDLSAWDIGIHDGGIYGLGVTFRLAAHRTTSRLGTEKPIASDY